MNCTLFEQVREIIVRQTGLSPEDIMPTSALSDHEGIDSLDQVEIIMDIEDTFDIAIPGEVAQKMTSISDIVKYLEVVIGERDEANRIDEFSQLLVNGCIQVSDIPDEFFIDVAKRVLLESPHSTMEAVLQRLKKKVSEMEELLEQKKRKLVELNKEIQQLEEVGEDGSCSEEQMRLEASSRLAQLVTALGLNPKVVNYWEEGRLYYSYLTAGGFMGSIDKIEYDSRYVDIVKQFEREYDLLVYHVIESGSALILLWVSNDSDEWECERLDDNIMMAYVYRLDDPDQSEFGDVVLSSLHGALTRIG